MKNRMRSLRLWVTPFALTVLALFALAFGAAGLGQRVNAEDLKLAEQSIRRAAVQCYALEGFYPARLEYLQARYGVQVEDGLIVHYAFIASNLMPDVTVLERQGKGGKAP